MKKNNRKTENKNLVRKRLMLTFSQRLVKEPITYRLIKEYDVAVNILFARVLPSETGKLVVEFTAEKEKSLENGLKFLKNLGVKIEPINKEIICDKDNCIDCGACTAVCRSGALSMDNKNYELVFEHDKCVLCEMCIHACPMRVISINF